jgi:hypothetical protein
MCRRRAQRTDQPSQGPPCPGPDATIRYSDCHHRAAGAKTYRAVSDSQDEIRGKSKSPNHLTEPAGMRPRMKLLRYLRASGDLDRLTANTTAFDAIPKLARQKLTVVVEVLTPRQLRVDMLVTAAVLRPCRSQSRHDARQRRGRASLGAGGILKVSDAQAWTAQTPHFCNIVTNWLMIV